MNVATLVLLALTLVAYEPEFGERPVAAQAAGAPRLVQPDVEDGTQWAASVIELTPLTGEPDQTVKLFGMGGGDPAMNGLRTYIAFYASPDEGWRVFEIGDFLDYRVVLDAPGRAELEITVSTYDDATSQIGHETQGLIVSWNWGADDGVPDQVSITPAA